MFMKRETEQYTKKKHTFALKFNKWQFKKQDICRNTPNCGAWKSKSKNTCENCTALVAVI